MYNKNNKNTNKHRGSPPSRRETAMAVTPSALSASSDPVAPALYCRNLKL